MTYKLLPVFQFLRLYHEYFNCFVITNLYIYCNRISATIVEFLLRLTKWMLGNCYLCLTIKVLTILLLYYSMIDLNDQRFRVFMTVLIIRSICHYRSKHFNCSAHFSNWYINLLFVKYPNNVWRLKIKYSYKFSYFLFSVLELRDRNTLTLSSAGGVRPHQSVTSWVRY